MNNEDLFQVWLMEMDDAIQRFIDSMPEGIGEHLDYSPDSLLVVEKFILDSYEKFEDVKKNSEAQKIDGAARYVGEVFRKHLGGKWMIDFSDPKNVFYGRPQLEGMRGQRVQECPLTLVTASVDRRTGKYIRTIFDNMCTRTP